MSFRTAYHSFKSGWRTSKPQGYPRDPTPEQWQKIMDQYYKRQIQNGGNKR